MTTFATPRPSLADIPRDHYGRPMIGHPDWSGPTAYQRVSTFAGLIDDKSNLINWASAMTLIGASRNETLIRAVRGLDYQEDKSKVLQLAEQAKTLGGAKNAAEDGTTLHRHTERIDTGVPLPNNLDAETVADLAAYRAATSILTPLMAESFVVIDSLKVAGTFDRLVEVADDARVPSWLRGRRVIADVKTGSIEYSVGSFAMQLALYSRGELYDPTTYRRTPLGADQGIGLVIHLPQRQGKAALYAVDLAAGWKGVQLAVAVKEYRAAATLRVKPDKQPVALKFYTS